MRNTFMHVMILAAASVEDVPKKAKDLLQCIAG